MTFPTPDRRLAAGTVGCLTLLFIGWTGLLVPSLIRSIKEAFGQTDAGIGLAYLVYAIAYALGSFVGGPLTERLGRRTVLGTAALLHASGIAGFGLAPTWAVFLMVMVLAGIGAGSLDGGANGLVLDVYRERRGRAMNLLHAFFSVGALLAPLVVGQAISAGVEWTTVVLATAVPVIVLAGAYFVVPMPSGRHDRSAAGTPDPSSPVSVALLSGPLLLLGVAIALYVAAEVGVSSWLVRFLEPAPLTTATLALSLYWAGIAVGRLLSAAVADRFDHLRFTIVCVVLMAGAIGAAIVVPSLPISIALFALGGVASGPVFPMIVALGGDRYPERSAAVGGALTGFAVIGSIVYPPAMGFLSVTVGLPAAMSGTVVLGLAGAVALVAFGGAARRAEAPV